MAQPMDCNFVWTLFASKDYLRLNSSGNPPNKLDEC